MTSPTTTPSRPELNTSLMVVTDAALTELDPVWQLNLSDIPAALMDVLPGLVDKWGTAAASTAADWYDHLRETSGVKGNFTAMVPPLDNLGPEALAGWGSEPIKALQNLAPRKGGGLSFADVAPSGGGLTVDDSALQKTQFLVEGGVQKRLVNAASLAVTTSSAQDPQSRGWMRRTRPGACKFCVMVASRGGVYTKATVTFACHEHCYCEAVPAWGGQALPVGKYKPSDRPSTATDRARVRKWIADNLP